MHVGSLCQLNNDVITPWLRNWTKLPSFIFGCNHEISTASAIVLLISQPVWLIGWLGAVVVWAVVAAYAWEAALTVAVTGTLELACACVLVDWLLLLLTAVLALSLLICAVCVALTAAWASFWSLVLIIPAAINVSNALLQNKFMLMNAIIHKKLLPIKAINLDC